MTLGSNLMEEACVSMCESLENDPYRWTATTHTLIDNKTGIEYWSSDRGQITSTWNGRSTNRVFSEAQGIRIWKSYEKMREIKASAAQQRVIQSLSKNTNKDQQVSISNISPVLIIVVVLLVVGVVSVFRMLG